MSDPDFRALARLTKAWERTTFGYYFPQDSSGAGRPPGSRRTTAQERREVADVYLQMYNKARAAGRAPTPLTEFCKSFRGLSPRTLNRILDEELEKRKKPISRN
jgi:hypothetical protein